MGHHIQGFIARADELRREAALLPGSRVIPLSLGYGFLPLTEQLVADDEHVSTEFFERLTGRFQTWAERASAEAPLVYVETEYFGGDGSQSAMAWLGARVAFGPVRTWDLWKDGKRISTPLLDGAINQVLRRIGVDRGSVRDEFDALGLGRHRSNESWLADDSR